ncbi:hypothetical protein MNV49_007146 [Pseudohyphozyma bogoriensis]|nr:hypothetical protein MNV49_007146 [Pseudohyphozyma bogoriensis]
MSTSWLAKLASPAAARKASSKGKAKSSLAKEDPRHDLHFELAALSTEARTPLGQSSIPRHLAQLFSLLSAELSAPTDSPAPLGPCLEFLLESGMLGTLVKLSTNDAAPDVRREVIRWFKRAVTELGEGFLTHSAVNKPLVRLLRACVDGDDGLGPEEEEAIVEVMGAICKRIRSSNELLAVFFREQAPSSSSRKDLSASLAAAISSSGPPRISLSRHDDSPRPSSPTPSTSTLSSSTHSSTHPASSSNPRKKSEHDFLLFAYLLRFVHRENRVGDVAREGLLDLVQVATLPSPTSSTPPSQGMSRTETSSTLTPSSVARLHSLSGAREAKLALAEYLLDSDFAEVLGAGLGALYGLLPSKLLVRSVGAGVSTSPKAGGSSGLRWDDPALDSGASGMVLGGMGALGDDVDPEEAERKREEEEMRLQALGVGISGTPEFREGLDGWLKLVEFIQEVLRASTQAADVAAALEEDVDEDDPRQQRLIASALTSSILSSFRTLFLQGVLYPSILECSDADGSAVAVLSYLDALLDVLEEGTAFEGTVVGFLMGEEDVKDLSQRAKNTEPLLSPEPAKRLRRRKSSALVLIESTSPRGLSSEPSSYFSSLGRFSLKDLLVSNVHSSSAGTATAALKLLQTMLMRHDRWSMGLLDVVLDEGATSFPIALREDAEDTPIPSIVKVPEAADDDDSDEEGFVYPDSDSEVFVYPTPTTPRALEGTPRAGTTPFTAPLSSLLLGTPLAPTPSITTRLDSLHTLLSLVASIDPSYRNARAMGGGSEILSTGFANYLQDAEDAMAADAGYQRGLMADPDVPRETVPTSPHARRRSRLFGAAPALSARDFTLAKTSYRHRLKTDSALLGHLLESLSHFFSHPPDQNLALTAVLSQLALCPYRSLEGWLFPPLPREDDLDDLEFERKRRHGPASDDGDDRSVDYEMDEHHRQDAFLSPTKSYVPTPIVLKTTGRSSGSLLAILAALASSVSKYRDAINDFDRYLSERREGLMFVDNLADALDFTDDGGNAFSDAVKGLETRIVDSPTPLPSKPKPKPSAFGSFLSPRSSPIADPFSTPPRSQPQPRRVASVASMDVAVATSGSRGAGPASPFAAHYRQTGSITVTPVVVGSGGDRDDEEEDDREPGEGPPDTPTKRLSPAVNTTAPTTPSVLSEGSEASPSAGRKKEQLQDVTLSTVLDNIILLEEFIKELAGVVSVRRSLGIDGIRFTGV